MATAIKEFAHTTPNTLTTRKNTNFAMASAPVAPDPIDLGPRTPKHLMHNARRTLISGSIHNLGEAPIPPRDAGNGAWGSTPPELSDNGDAPSATTPPPLNDCPTPTNIFDATIRGSDKPDITTAAFTAGVAADARAILDEKLRVFRAFSLAFDKTAQQFATGHAHQFAQTLAHGFIQYCKTALSGQTTAPAINTSRKKQTYAAALNTTNLGHRENPQNASPPIAERENAPREDLRVFIRLDPNSPAWGKDTSTIRSFISTKLGMKLEAVPQAKLVNSGWAITPRTRTIRDKILQLDQEISRELGATAVEPTIKWHTYVIHNCPRQIFAYGGSALEMDSLYQEEVLAQAGIPAVSLRLSKHSPPDSLEVTILASFAKRVPHRFKLFNQSLLSREVVKNRPPEQCGTCWDYHSSRNCAKTPRCKTCSNLAHGDSHCEKQVRCINC